MSCATPAGLRNTRDEGNFCSSYRGKKDFSDDELQQQRQLCLRHYQGPAKANLVAVPTPVHTRPTPE